MKMSNIHMELEEQAQELGFEDLEEAQEAGCVVEWHENSAELVEPSEAAHRAWEKEKEEVLDGLDIAVHADAIPFEYKEIVKEAIEFIKKGEV